MRTPWRSPTDESFSWTTLWMNLAALVVVVRFAIGAGFTFGSFSYQPGELEPTLVAAIMATLGGMYTFRRHQEAATPTTTVTATVTERAPTASP